MPTPDYAPSASGIRSSPRRGPIRWVPFASCEAGPHPTLIVYIENAGDIAIPVPAIRAVHDGKVVLDPDKLEDKIRRALGHVRDSEVPGW